MKCIGVAVIPLLLLCESACAQNIADDRDYFSIVDINGIYTPYIQCLETQVGKNQQQRNAFGYPSINKLLGEIEPNCASLKENADSMIFDREGSWNRSLSKEEMQKELSYFLNFRKSHVVRAFEHYNFENDKWQLLSVNLNSLMPFYECMENVVFAQIAAYKTPPISEHSIFYIEQKARIECEKTRPGRYTNIDLADMQKSLNWGGFSYAENEFWNRDKRFLIKSLKIDIKPEIIPKPASTGKPE